MILVSLMTATILVLSMIMMYSGANPAKKGAIKMPQLLETLKDVAVKGKIIVCQQCKRIRLKDGVQTDCGDFKTPAKWSHPVPGLLPEIEKVYTVVKTVCCKCTTGGMQ